MKTALRYLAYCSVLINIYVFAMWIYAFNTSNKQEERVRRFNELVPSFNSIYIQTLILVALSIISIFYLAKAANAYNKVIMALQIFCVFIYVFQHM
jgi:ABC-type xylose transport system permease subunit